MDDDDYEETEIKSAYFFKFETSVIYKQHFHVNCWNYSLFLFRYTNGFVEQQWLCCRYDFIFSC